MMEFLEKLMSSCNAHSTAPTKALGQSITLLKVQEIIGNTVNLPLAGAPHSFSSLLHFFFYCCFRTISLCQCVHIWRWIHWQSVLADLIVHNIVRCQFRYFTIWFHFLAMLTCPAKFLDLYKFVDFLGGLSFYCFFLKKVHLFGLGTLRFQIILKFGIKW